MQYINKTISTLSHVLRAMTFAGVKSALSSTSNNFVVGSITPGSSGYTFSISPDPVIHASENAARTEAERLASVNKGKFFVVLKFNGGGYVPNVEINHARF